MKSPAAEYSASVSAFLLCIFVLFAFCCAPHGNKVEQPVPLPSAVPVTAEDVAQHIFWYGNAAVKLISAHTVIFFDPFEVPPQAPADVVLISHPHFDHLSPADLRKVAGENTVFVTPRDKTCIKTIRALFHKDPITLKPGEQKSVAGITIEAVPAYNLNEAKGHPRAMGWVGYIITVDGIRVYHAGDTAHIPEMKTLACDIALLPLGQLYTMQSVEDAARAALDVRAGIAIPIHYGSYEGTENDAYRFKELLTGKVRVIIKKKER
jgi:L-ascorbate metabolism protein UlaG (beta-lactamase superfamily)